MAENKYLSDIEIKILAQARIYWIMELEKNEISFDKKNSISEVDVARYFTTWDKRRIDFVKIQYFRTMWYFIKISKMKKFNIFEKGKFKEEKKFFKIERKTLNYIEFNLFRIRELTSIKVVFL